MEALSQLSYGPTRSRGKLRTLLHIVKLDRAPVGYFGVVAYSSSGATSALSNLSSRTF